MTARTALRAIWYRTTIATKRLGAASAWVQHYGHVATCIRCWQGVRLGRQVAKGIILLPLAGTTPSVVPPAQGEARSGPPTASREQPSDQHFEIGPGCASAASAAQCRRPCGTGERGIQHSCDVQIEAGRVHLRRARGDNESSLLRVQQRGCLQLNLSLLLVRQPRGSPHD